MITFMRALSIGALAEATGVNLETIRYYERIGLMPEPDRTRAGHRRYSPAHGRRLAFIRRARELGFVLADVRSLLALAEPGRTSCSGVRALASAHLGAVRARIADLDRLAGVLAGTIARCDAGRIHCPVLDMLERER
ncbi:MAG: helix-turn-helix domain-containing protein [Alphaproteobacteria bacterium]